MLVQETAKRVKIHFSPISEFEHQSSKCVGDCMVILHSTNYAIIYFYMSTDNIIVCGILSNHPLAHANMFTCVSLEMKVD